MLQEFVTANRAEIVARCRALIANRPALRANALELEYGIPLFIDQLTARLRIAQGSKPPIGATGTTHGNELLHPGFTIAQVVQDYSGICRTITELAIEKAVPIATNEFQALNGCLDEAIAGAVSEYARLREHEGTERLGRLAHELRNHLNSALLAYEMLNMGTVEVAGSTGSVLGRSLSSLRNLIDRELAEVRLGAGIYHRETILVSKLLEDVEVPAMMEANARGVQFSVVPGERELSIHVDRPIIEAVVANLLQNAFKFTHPRGQVVLRTTGTDERVLIEVEDQCGGLPAGKAAELFRPFEQRSTDRKGLGLGLEICARGVRINEGLIRVRDEPGRGCVFTVDLPRVAPPSLVASDLDRAGTENGTSGLSAA